MKLTVKTGDAPRRKVKVKAKQRSQTGPSRKRGWEGPHTWTQCKKTAPLVIAAWQRLLKGGTEARGIPSYLYGVWKATKNYAPGKELGILELRRDAERILNGSLRPYKLRPNPRVDGSRRSGRTQRSDVSGSEDHGAASPAHRRGSE